MKYFAIVLNSTTSGTRDIILVCYKLFNGKIIRNDYMNPLHVLLNFVRKRFWLWYLHICLEPRACLFTYMILEFFLYCKLYYVLSITYCLDFYIENVSFMEIVWTSSKFTYNSTSVVLNGFPFFPTISCNSPQNDYNQLFIHIEQHMKQIFFF